MARGMASTPDAIFAAGPVMSPEDAGTNEPAFDGGGPAVMAAFGTEGGEELSRIAIEAPPVFDGLALAYGKVYMSTVDGRVVSYAEK